MPKRQSFDSKPPSSNSHTPRPRTPNLKPESRDSFAMIMHTAEPESFRAWFGVCYSVQT